MATLSSTRAWKIPWMEEPGRLQSMGSRRVRHNWATSLSLVTFMHWRKKWQPTRVFLPGESQGWGSLVGCHLWESTESDRTEATQQCVCFQATLSIFPILSSPAPLCPRLCSLCIHGCPANRFISTIFLDSTHLPSYETFAFLFLTYFTLYSRLLVHPPR